MRKVIVAALSAIMALALAAPAIARAPQATGAQPGSSTIVEIVISNPGGNFDVLLAAVLAADPAVVSALADNEQYTVFAPTDQAFINTLGVANEAEAIAAVQGLPQGALTDILLYHVIDGRRTGTSVLAAPRYDTLLGETLTRGELGAAGVQAANISASNGVVHVLTKGVLIP
jgi:transforming growth factor-beta-induced protein